MVPVRVHTIIISTQHDESVTNEKIAQDLKEHVIKPVIPAQYLDDNTIFHLIPSGRLLLVVPMEMLDSLAGKLLSIHTVGGVPTVEVPSQEKIPPGWKGVEHTLLGRQERVVSSGLARRCIVQVSYAIGIPVPLSGFVDA